MTRRRNPNYAAGRVRLAALHAEAAAGPAEHFAGEVVRVRRDDGRIDTVRIITIWTAHASGIPMLTVMQHPHGISPASVRADAVVTDEEA